VRDVLPALRALHISIQPVSVIDTHFETNAVPMRGEGEPGPSPAT
jgi:hypothetical protein